MSSFYAPLVAVHVALSRRRMTPSTSAVNAANDLNEMPQHMDFAISQWATHASEMKRHCHRGSGA